jgi:two-component system chemotaxis response regulator CheB
MPVKVLAVDDSALIRSLMKEILKGSSEFQLVGAARDPYEARELIKRLNPDVLTLDVEMPKMDGLAFLQNLMRLRPMPVVMLSSLTEKGGEVAMRALELGAVDVVTKPKEDLAHTFADLREEILAKLRGASRARVSALRSAVAPKKRSSLRLTHGLVAIGASTGGTEAIRQVLAQFPADAPATVVTQHIPSHFSRMFAKSLDAATSVRVKEAEEGEELRPGHVYVAPGDRHLVVVKSGARFVARLDGGPAVNRHRPSVDVMFESLAKASPENCVAVLLTGMGDDGARGLLALRRMGAKTLAQDEESSVVFGMPKAAVQLGAAQAVIPLEDVADRLLEAR